MKMTLLEMVQNILSSTDGDNVNSISDTTEAVQVAEIIKQTYYSLISRRDWEFMRTMQHLDGVGDIDKPTKLKIPDTLQSVTCFRYRYTEPDSTTNWVDLIYLRPCDFIERVQRKIDSSSSTSTTNDSGVELIIRTNVRPKYWTSFDDKYIYCDSYDSSNETTLQASNTTVEGVKRPDWTVSDTFTPNLPSEMFQLLLNESKSIAHLELKQAVHAKAEQDARRQYIIMREQEPTVKKERLFVDYGKKSGRRYTWGQGVATSSGLRYFPS